MRLPHGFQLVADQQKQTNVPEGFELVTDQQNRPPSATPDGVPEEVPVMARVGQGMMDFYGGVKQNYLNVTDSEAAEKYTAQQNENNEIIARGREAHGDTGFDVARFLGTLATPLSAIPGGTGGVLSRAAIGAATGAAGGALNFDPQNTAGTRSESTGVGGVGGALIPLLLPTALRTAFKGVQAASNAVGGGWRAFSQTVSPKAAETISREVKGALQDSGVNFSQLPEAIQRSVLDDAAKQLTVTGKLNPEVLLRKVQIEEVGGAGTATRAQVTRDPIDWTAAQNAQKQEVNIPAITRDGLESLTNRFSQQNANTNKYAEALKNQMVDGDVIKAGTPFDASTQAIQAIQAKDAAAKTAVDDLYKAFRDMGKGDVSVPDTKIARELGEIADEIGVENIPPAVLSRLKEFGYLDGTRTKLLTVTEADKLGRLIGNNNPGHGTVGLVSTRLKRAVDNAILDIPEIEASQALMTARNNAFARFTDQKAGLGVRRAIADVAPDKFFQQNIINGNVRDINALKGELAKTAEGQVAWGALRKEAMAWIIDRATSTNGVFSGQRMDVAIKKLGEDRLNAIFSPAEMAQIKTLLSGSKAMTLEPAFAAPNRSNTAPALMGAALRIGNQIPGLNLMAKPIAEEVEARAQQKMLAKALDGKSFSMGRDAAQAAKRAALVKMITTDRAMNPSMIPAATQQQYKTAR
tara:strand:+ start:16319 stop:18400 length:2082 start_codon:yes stop_codon:yes gene_type:complete